MMTSMAAKLVIILQVLIFFPLSLPKIAGDLLDLAGDSAFETVQDLISVRDVFLIKYFVNYILNF